MLVVGESVGKIERMYVLPNSTAKKRLVAAAPLALLAFFALWRGMRGSMPQSARDFEECAEQVEVASLSTERAASMSDCDARFAGRRKPGGDYTYYDFMQNRHFDIMDANPTPEERNQIDYAYMDFLAAQRREAVSAELAERQNNQLRADLESARQPVGRPMVLTPANLAPKPHEGRLIDRRRNPVRMVHCLQLGKVFSGRKDCLGSSSKRQLNPAVASD